MTIGTSLGAFHEDDFAHIAAPWTDNNVIDPDTQGKDDTANDPINIPPSIKTPDFITEVGDKYDTPLSAEQQADYSSKFDDNASKEYDMQGWYKANSDVDPHTDGTHYPDTYKKPNHPTFSDESQYSTKDTPGGHWDQLSDKTWTFAPSSENFKHNSLDDIKDYLKSSDPNVKLVLNPQDL